jgi:ribosomal-protein-alanine N-acetyltransferase
MTYSWPVVLKSEDLSLQALRFRDRGRWNNVRAENRDWLSPWEATIPLIPGDAAENASEPLTLRLEVAAHFHLLSGISAI